MHKPPNDHKIRNIFTDKLCSELDEINTTIEQTSELYAKVSQKILPSKIVQEITKDNALSYEDLVKTRISDSYSEDELKEIFREDIIDIIKNKTLEEVFEPEFIKIWCSSNTSTTRDQTDGITNSGLWSKIIQVSEKRDTWQIAEIFLTQDIVLRYTEEDKLKKLLVKLLSYSITTHIDIDRPKYTVLVRHDDNVITDLMLDDNKKLLSALGIQSLYLSSKDKGITILEFTDIAQMRWFICKIYDVAIKEEATLEQKFYSVKKALIGSIAFTIISAVCYVGIFLYHKYTHKTNSFFSSKEIIKVSIALAVILASILGTTFTFKIKKHAKRKEKLNAIKSYQDSMESEQNKFELCTRDPKQRAYRESSESIETDNKVTLDSLYKCLEFDRSIQISDIKYDLDKSTFTCKSSVHTKKSSLLINKEQYKETLGLNFVNQNTGSPQYQKLTFNNSAVPQQILQKYSEVITKFVKSMENIGCTSIKDALPLTTLLVTPSIVLIGFTVTVSCVYHAYAIRVLQSIKIRGVQLFHYKSHAYIALALLNILVITIALLPAISHIMRYLLYRRLKSQLTSINYNIEQLVNYNIAVVQKEIEDITLSLEELIKENDVLEARQQQIEEIQLQVNNQLLQMLDTGSKIKELFQQLMQYCKTITNTYDNILKLLRSIIDNDSDDVAQFVIDMIVPCYEIYVLIIEYTALPDILREKLDNLNDHPDEYTNLEDNEEQKPVGYKQKLDKIRELYTSAQERYTKHKTLQQGINSSFQWLKELQKRIEQYRIGDYTPLTHEDIMKIARYSHNIIHPIASQNDSKKIEEIEDTKSFTSYNKDNSSTAVLCRDVTSNVENENTEDCNDGQVIKQSTETIDKAKELYIYLSLDFSQDRQRIIQKIEVLIGELDDFSTEEFQGQISTLNSMQKQLEQYQKDIEEAINTCTGKIEDHRSQLEDKQKELDRLHDQPPSTKESLTKIQTQKVNTGEKVREGILDIEDDTEQSTREVDEDISEPGCVITNSTDEHMTATYPPQQAQY